MLGEEFDYLITTEENSSIKSVKISLSKRDIFKITTTKRQKSSTKEEDQEEDRRTKAL
jgi:hypothetical protein